MRILLSGNHPYPASDRQGSGMNPKPFPSRSGNHIHDLLAKGLPQLGHEVFYLLPAGTREPLPPGVRLITEPIDEIDILHVMAFRDEKLVEYMVSRGKPWVNTCHLDQHARGKPRWPTTPNWIYVSRSLANSHGSNRWVWNGLDPDDYEYSEVKQDYLFFMCTLDWAFEKGLTMALRVAHTAGIKLLVAGTGTTQEAIDRVQNACQAMGATCVGEVRGAEKARLIANAKGLIFPTELNESFGLVMVEALLSGTPVICSANGACPELISPDLGFVCRDFEEYRQAVERLGEISPQVCRAKAITDFHYMRMASDYVREYEAEISSARGA
jgi:glycosyltransferase involved in cell wall biosynthesis